MSRHDPRYVYRGGPEIEKFMRDWQVAADKIMAAAAEWNDAHEGDWKLTPVHNREWDYSYGDPHDLHPDWHSRRDDPADVRAVAEKRMKPLRAGLTKRGTPYQDKRGQVWRDELASLPPLPRFGKRASELGLGGNFWYADTPDRENGPRGQGYYGTPGTAMYDDVRWITSMFEINNPHLTPATLAEYYEARARHEAAPAAPVDPDELADVEF